MNYTGKWGFNISRLSQTVRPWRTRKCSRRLSKYLRNGGSYRQEVDCFGKTLSSRFGISHPISIISNGPDFTDKKPNRKSPTSTWRLWAVAPSPGLKKTPNPEKGPASSKFFYPLSILLKFVMIWRNQSRSLENNCLSRDIQFAHRVFFQCPLSKQKCIQKNEARMAQIQIWWIPRRIPLTF